MSTSNGPATSSRSFNMSYLLAFALLLMVVGWMLSAGLEEPEAAPEPASKQRMQAKSTATKVVVSIPPATQVESTIDLSAQTEPSRMVTIKSEIRARVIKLHKQRGDLVARGDLLVELDPRDWPDRVAQARANLHQRQLEQKSVVALRKRGLANESQEAQAATSVANAQAELKSAELQLNATRLRSPFDGVLNDRFVEIGDFLKDGDAIAEILDLDPLLVSAQLPEHHLKHIHAGMPATATLVDGRSVEGHIRYFSRSASTTTRTFRVELEVSNPGQLTFSSGSTATLQLPTGKQSLHQLSPALLVLDEHGNMGVKGVDNKNQVTFLPVELSGADDKGAWLSGIPDGTRIITRGQGYVSVGQSVLVEQSNDDVIGSTPVANGEH